MSESFDSIPGMGVLEDELAAMVLNTVNEVVRKTSEKARDAVVDYLYEEFMLGTNTDEVERPFILYKQVKTLAEFTRVRMFATLLATTSLLVSIGIFVYTLVPSMCTAYVVGAVLVVTTIYMLYFTWKQSHTDPMGDILQQIRTMKRTQLV